MSVILYTRFSTYGSSSLVYQTLFIGMWLYMFFKFSNFFKRDPSCYEASVGRYQRRRIDNYARHHREENQNEREMYTILGTWLSSMTKHRLRKKEKMKIRKKEKRKKHLHRKLRLITLPQKSPSSRDTDLFRRLDVFVQGVASSCNERSRWSHVIFVSAIIYKYIHIYM